MGNGGHIMNNENKKYMLIVDDSKTNRAVLRGIFENDYICAEASDGLEASILLDRQDFSVVILDLNMPHMDGFELLDHMQATADLKSIPVIINTQFGQEENELKARSKGAMDFITKPYNPEIVRQRIHNILAALELERAVIETEADKRSYEKMKRLVENDTLTGLYSEHGFCSYADRLRMENPGKNYTLLRFDIDHFKAITEIFGPDRSSRVLITIARKLKHDIGKKGVCGRIGADIFVVCFETGTIDMGRFIESLEEEAGESLSGYTIAMYSGSYPMDSNDTPISIMIDRAGLAIQQNKGNYTNRHINYDTDLKDHILEEQSLIQDMEQSIKNKEFVIRIQPIYDIKTGKIVTAEALVRWNHKTRGLLSPDHFIPVFEKNGMVAALDHYVWELTASLQKKISDLGITPPPVSVNVSRVNLFLPSLAQDVLDIINKYELDPSLIKLEITESGRTRDRIRLDEAVGKLKDAGFTIVMDDFGTGYSSLQVLKDLPIDVVKIDMNFVASLADSKKSAIIIKHMSQMAREMGLTVVAEGVETKDELKYLQSVECDQIQGYYFSKPLTVEEYMEKLKD